MASVRYIVDDVDAAIDFYAGRLGFAVEMRPAPSFALLSRDDLRLMVSATAGAGGGSQPMPDGRGAEPGGWDRIMIEVEGLEGEGGGLRAAGARFRHEVATGRGVRQTVPNDPAATPAELSEPLSRTP